MHVVKSVMKTLKDHELYKEVIEWYWSMFFNWSNRILRSGLVKEEKIQLIQNIKFEIDGAFAQRIF